MPPSVPDTDGQWRCIGRHRLRVEPDNTVLAKYIGPISLKEIEEITQHLIAVRQTGPLYMLSDLSESGVPTAENGTGQLGLVCLQF